MLSPVFRLDTPPELGLKAVTFTLHGLDNRHYSAPLLQRLDELRAAFDPGHSLTAQHGFLALRERIDRSPRRFPPSPLALFEQNRRHGRLRSITPVVDLYNQWSLNSGLSIGAHDLQRVRVPVRLTLTRGGESFHGLGSAECGALPPGEYAYIDAAERVLCRLEYRQAAASALQEHSSGVLFIVQGHAQTPIHYLRSVADGLKADLQACCTRELRRAG